MRTLRAVVLVALLFGSATADAPTARTAKADEIVTVDGGIELKAPLTCEVGELVRFDARESDVDALVWDIIPPTPDFEIVDKRGFFSARSGGEFLILIAGAKGGKAFLVHQRLTVTGAAIPSTGLTRKVEDWLKLVPESADKKAKLVGMAGVFRKLAEKPVSPEKMVEATALANSAVLGDSVKTWVPFLEKLGTELDAMVAAKTLTTIEQYQTAWREIASAMEAAAR